MGPDKKAPLLHLLSFHFLLSLGWTLALAGSLAWTFSEEREELENAAKLSARVSFEKDVAYRNWNSAIGGLYAPISDRVQPNPYLAAYAQRDLTTTDGRRFTLINPAYMNRMVEEGPTTHKYIHGHITSLNPISPENGPDAWEAAALAELVHGTSSEVSSIEVINGNEYMRLMRPLVTEPSCTQCHDGPGYKVGEIGGGISENVALAPLRVPNRAHMAGQTFVHLGLWLLGLTGITIGARRQTRDASRLCQLSQVVEQSPASIIITDTEGRITFANAGFTTVTGYRPDEVIGKTPRILKSGYTSADEYGVLWDQIKSGVTWRGELHNRRKDGSLFWEMATISPVTGENGSITHFVAVKEDITERKQREIDLVVANERAEAGNRAKSQFLSMMSHELRTPLNAIIGFSDVLANERLGPLDNPHYKAFSQHIMTGGQSLLNLINDLLEMSTVTSGNLELHPEPFPVERLLETALSAVRTRAAAGGLHLSLDAPGNLPWLEADERALLHALVHLLANAIKFTPRDGKVILRMRPEPEGGLTLAVIDTGIGINPEHMEKVMRPFIQADNALGRRFEGAGLGLPLAARLTAYHGGRLTLESEPGTGTTATIRLPADHIIPASG
ncbi:MAG: PAS domain S-box protein [Rhodospirillaceae bacterium]